MAKFAIMVQTVQITCSVGALSFFFNSHTCGGNSRTWLLDCLRFAPTRVPSTRVVHSDIKYMETKEQGQLDADSEGTTSRRHMPVTHHYQVKM